MSELEQEIKNLEHKIMLLSSKKEGKVKEKKVGTVPPVPPDIRIKVKTSTRKEKKGLKRKSLELKGENESIQLQKIAMDLMFKKGKLQRGTVPSRNVSVSGPHLPKYNR